MFLHKFSNLISLLVCFLCLTWALHYTFKNTQAAEATFSDFTILQVKGLSFGIIEVPNIPATLTVTPDGSAPQGDATIIIDTTQRGEYLLRGASNAITLDIANITTGTSLLKINSFKGVYGGQLIKGFPKSDLPAPKEGAPFYLGATLHISPGITERTHMMTFDVIVTYP